MTAAACAGFVAAIPIVHDRIGYAAAGAAAVAALAFAVLDRSRLRLALVPWQLLMTGLFLVVPTLSRFGHSGVMSALIGTDPGPVGVFRATAAGAGLSNVLNNLPAYTAGRP